MRKVPLSDGSGHWFDRDKAKSWEERVSAVEEQHRDANDPHGEKLYFTDKCNFVLYRWHWSMEDLYLPIDQEKAARWLIANGYQKDVSQLELQSEERGLEI